MLNWYAGWALILAGFGVGAILGTRFHQDHFWGGYASLRRRLARLGHIAMVALGMLNVLFAIALPMGRIDSVASALLLIGSIAMPLNCFLSAWRPTFRHAFFIPVLCLFIAVSAILFGGLP